MLWSLFKILLFVALVAALTLAAMFLLESGGELRIAVAGTEFTLGPLAGVVAVLVLLLLLWLALRIVGLLVALLRFARGDRTALSRYFDRNRERKGFRALSDAMLALASGEGRLAMTKARRAERYLRRPELTNILTAQAAEASGDRARAEAVYRRMVGDDRTRFVGVRGLMHQKLSDGDTDTALRLAERAFALKPKHEEVQDTLLRLQAGQEDWPGARRTLNAKLRHGSLPRDVHKRRDAVLAVAEAREALDNGRTEAAHASAIEANRLSPQLVPAAAMAARSYIRQGRPRYASRVITKAWAVQPHPDLAAAFAEIAPEETPQARLKRFRALTRTHADDPETRLLLAELHIAAEDFPAARRALGDLPETHPTSRTLAIMAAIERGVGTDEDVVRGWLTRALTAPRGPQWVCSGCGTRHAEWLPVCRTCSGFDLLTWTTPPEGEAGLPHSAELLPVFVGNRSLGESAPTDDREAPAPPEEPASAQATPATAPSGTPSEAADSSAAADDSRTRD